MVEIIAIPLGLVLLVLALCGQKWLVGLAGMLLGIAALTGLGLLAWVSLSGDSRAIAAVVRGVIDGVKVAPEAVVLALLGVALVGLVFARRRCASWRG